MWRVPLVLAVLALAAYGLWGAFKLGEPPQVELLPQYAAIGREHQVEARFRAPSDGLGWVRIEVQQGDRTEVVAEQRLARPGAFELGRGHRTREQTLRAEIGTRALGWLEEGEATVRAVADRLAGPFRSVEPVVVETTMAVRSRPPRLDVVSSRHWLRQGGSGLVVIRVGDTVVASGVVAGAAVSPSSGHPSGRADERVVLFGIPWDLEDGSAVRVFAQDDAGNRVEQGFADSFRRRELKTDTVAVTDDFLERVVPAIASRTPGFVAEGTLIEQYLRINGDQRRGNLRAVRDLSKATASDFLWSGTFEQLPRSALQAGFAERRVYRYQGEEVDRQTHLGIDLASTSRAVVPAAGAGRVVWADWLAIYGNFVLVDHGLGLMTGYGHLSQIDVAVGDRVERGWALGRTGTTGLAGGDHLHFEVFVHGQSVDPLEWLDPQWVRTSILDRLGAE